MRACLPLQRPMLRWWHTTRWTCPTLESLPTTWPRRSWRRACPSTASSQSAPSRARASRCVRVGVCRVGRPRRARCHPWPRTTAPWTPWAPPPRRNAPQELVRGVHALLDELGPARVARETDAQNVTEVPRRRDERVDDFTVQVWGGRRGRRSGRREGSFCCAFIRMRARPATPTSAHHVAVRVARHVGCAQVEEVLGSTSPGGGPLRVFYVEGVGLAKFSQVRTGLRKQASKAQARVRRQVHQRLRARTWWCSPVAACSFAGAACFQMTNWSYWDAVRRFQRVLEVSGVNARLLERGIRVRRTCGALRTAAPGLQQRPPPMFADPALAAWLCRRATRS